MIIDTHCHLEKQYYDNIDEVISKMKNNIIITIGSKEALEVAEQIGQETGKQIRAHLKIDTGFGRYGFVYSQREEIVETLQSLKNVKRLKN